MDKHQHSDKQSLPLVHRHSLAAPPSALRPLWAAQNLHSARHRNQPLASQGSCKHQSRHSARRLSPVVLLPLARYSKIRAFRNLVADSNSRPVLGSNGKRQVALAQLQVLDRPLVSLAPAQTHSQRLVRQAIQAARLGLSARQITIRSLQSRRHQHSARHRSLLATCSESLLSPLAASSENQVESHRPLHLSRPHHRCKTLKHQNSEPRHSLVLRCQRLLGLQDSLPPPMGLGRNPTARARPQEVSQTARGLQQAYPMWKLTPHE